MSRTVAAISVLLVEDEVMISNLVADCLSESGFRVHEVVTADEALRFIKSGANVDVLFTDINLPGGMNGAELAERVRELRPEMPIVYVSGRYTVSEISPLVPRSLFVAKPYDPNDICALLTRLTCGRGAPA
jgi:CheY-like chemotaxis protein